MMRRYAWPLLYICFAVGIWAWTLTALAWLPSALYGQAGTDFLLYGGGSAGNARADQLAATSSVNSTDSILNCQGCSSSTNLKTSPVTQIAAQVASIIVSQQNVWTATQEISPCVLTNASSIIVNVACAHVFTIQLSANNQTLACPTGTIAAGKYIDVSFFIQQPASGSPDGLLWDTCWTFTAGTPPTQGSGLSAANSATDLVTCKVLGGSPNTGYCGAPQSNLASSSQFALRDNHTTSGIGANGTTIAVTINNSMSGDLRTVELFANPPNVAIARATSVTDNTNTCSPVNSAFYNGANGASTDIWVCPRIVGSTAATITATWPQSVPNPCALVQEWTPSVFAPDAGLGNTATGTGANPSVATSASVTQIGELVISLFNDATATTANAGTLIDLCSGSNNIIAQYQLAGSLTAITNSVTAAAGRWSGSIAAFTHY